MSFNLKRDVASPACVVDLHGEMDLAVVEGLRPELESMIESGCVNYVLDLTDVTYADSSALGLVVWLNDLVAPDGGRIVVAGANRDVSRILELSGLLMVAPSICDAESTEAALASFAPENADVQPLWTERIEAPALVSELSRLRSRVGELTAPLGLSEQAAFDVKVAVGEALANAVRHGSPKGGDDTVQVVVSAFPDRVVVDVEDSGCGFDGNPGCTEDLYAPCGRGVVFMRALCDRVEFLPGPDTGTIVRMVKHIRGARTEA